MTHDPADYPHYAQLEERDQKMALLKARGKTNSQIARELDIARNTVIAFFAKPIAAEAVAECKRMLARISFEEIQSSIPVANSAYRMSRIQNALDRIEQVWEERGEALKDIPGGETGLLIAKPTKDGLLMIDGTSLIREYANLNELARMEQGNGFGQIETEQALPADLQQLAQRIFTNDGAGTVVESSS